MAFDALVSSPGRLTILTALAAEPVQPFVQLRNATGLTDGNLATHARRLESAGFIAIEKSITGGKPLTTLHLTRQGRNALAEHARSLLAALDHAGAGAGAADNLASTDSAEAMTADLTDDDWVD